jgi:uncharacterized protein (DUF2147 family)
MQRYLIFISVILTTSAFSQSIVGQWKTIDDNTGKEKSIVEIYEKGGKAYGKIVKLFRKPGEDQDPVCNKCPEDDTRYKKKIIGMEILNDLIKAGNEYINGSVLDPENGKIYRCKVWLEGSDLYVRGYWGPFYRTQTWKKMKQ